MDGKSRQQASRRAMSPASEPPHARTGTWATWPSGEFSRKPERLLLGVQQSGTFLDTGILVANEHLDQ